MVGVYIKLNKLYFKVIYHPFFCFSAEKTMVISSLSGEPVVSLTAELKRGKGENAWQHTQLFRQSLDGVNEFPFDIKIYLKKK